MNNFKENLKESANDKKREIMNIWNEIICSYFIKSLDEIIELQDKAREKLSRDELIAIYEISTEVKKLILCQKTNHPLFEFLQISNFDVNSEKLLALVDATVKDMNEGRKLNPNGKWHFQSGKILKRMNNETNDTKVYLSPIKINEEK